MPAESALADSEMTMALAKVSERFRESLRASSHSSSDSTNATAISVPAKRAQPAARTTQQNASGCVTTFTATAQPSAVDQVKLRRAPSTYTGVSTINVNVNAMGHERTTRLAYFKVSGPC